MSYFLSLSLRDEVNLLDFLTGYGTSSTGFSLNYFLKCNNDIKFGFKREKWHRFINRG